MSLSPPAAAGRKGSGEKPCVPCAHLASKLAFALCCLTLTSLSSVIRFMPANKGKVTFVDVAQSAGLNAKNTCGSTEKRYIIESMGNGGAFFDYDGDGYLDVLIVRSSTIENLKRGGGQICALYRNNQDGTFRDVTASSGLTRRGWGMGVCVADYDNDGWQDVYITGIGANVLYRNNGDGTFRDVTETAGVAGGGWSASAAFGDYDLDGYVDLYVTRYVDFDIYNPPVVHKRFCQYKGIEVYCGPRGLKGLSDLFYRNNGDGTFSLVNEEAGVTDAENFYGLGVVFGDYDNDGDQDIYVANDMNPNFLFRNNGDGTFKEVGLMAGCAYSEDGREQAGMGVDFGDYDNDGDLDIFVTNFSDDYYTLYRNNGNGSFTDVSWRSGIAQATWAYLGWGTNFVDYDNDGWLDIFAANGHVFPQVDQRDTGTSYLQRYLLFRNRRDGTFEEIGSQCGEVFSSRKGGRGAAFGDYDNDGDMDILVVNIDDVPALLRNDGGNNSNWITLKLVGTKSNRDAIGARVKATVGGLTQIREVKSGSSYLSNNDMRVHFGLGDAGQVDSIQIRWPSGLIQTLKDVRANQLILIKEPSRL